MNVRFPTCLLILALGAAAAPPPDGPPPDRAAALSRGVNITGWFRYPASRDPAALGRWLSDAAIRDIRAAGFTFVRLPLDPALMEDPAALEALIAAIGRLHQAGLAVMTGPHPVGWRLEDSAADRGRLHRFWRDVAPALGRTGTGRTFPEVLNEPVFPGDAAGWQSLRDAVTAEIRAALPNATIVLTGHDWGSAAGLLALTPSDDPKVIYTFHFYDPAELTGLAAYRPGLDRGALAALPFPVIDQGGCGAVAARASDAATGDLMRFYCAQRWDAAQISARITAVADWARRHRATVVLGEFGAHAALNAPARLAWLRAVREGCEAEGIGWALWGYDDIMGLTVARPPSPRPRLDAAVLTALGLRPR